MEEFRSVALATHHVDPLGIRFFLGYIARVSQSLGQGGALLGHDQGAGLGDLAQHKNLVEAAVLHVENVARLQQSVLFGGALFVHGLDVHPVCGALAGEQHAAVVGLGAEATGAVDGLQHGHGNVGHVLLAGLEHFAHHIHALAAEGRHAHIQLHLFDELGEALREQVADLAGSLAIDVERAHIGVEDSAVFSHHGAGLVGGAVLTGRGGELGVVPHDDGEDVPRAYLVVQRRRQRRIRLLGSGTGLGHGLIRQAVLFRGSGLHLLDDQLGGDGLDGDVVRYGLFTLLDGQLDGGLVIAQRIGLVARHDGGTGRGQGCRDESQGKTTALKGAGGAGLGVSLIDHGPIVSVGGRPSATWAERGAGCLPAGSPRSGRPGPLGFD